MKSKYRTREDLFKEIGQLKSKISKANRSALKQEQIKKTLHQFEQIVSSSTDMIALLDNEYKYLATNGTYAKAFNLTIKELVGNTVSHVFGKDFFKTTIKSNADRCLSGEIINYQDWFNFPACKRCYMDVRYFPYYNKDSEIEGFVVNARNITKQKEAEEILYLKDLVFKSSIAANSIADINGIIIEANPAFLNIWGYDSKEEVIGKPIPDFLENIEDAKEIITSLQNTDRWTGSYNARKKDGSIFRAQSIATVLRDENNDLIGYQSSVVDVSEKKKAELKLQTERDNLISILNSMADGVYITDKNYDLNFVNNVFRKKFGPVGNKKCYEYLHGFKKPCTNCKNGDVINGETIRSLQDYKYNKKTYSLIFTPIKSINNTTQKLAIARDITNIIKMNKELQKHQKHLEQLVAERTQELIKKNLELQAQQEKVREANNLKSEFLSNMSHELRTPLNSILALSQVMIMQSKNKLNNEENNFLKIILRNGKHLLDLINSILDLSKIEAGKMEISITKISTALLLNDSIESLIPLAEKKGLLLNLHIPKKSPVIETDKMKLQQVIINIINNAIKFTNNGVIDVLLESDRKCIYIRVKDTGVGISKEALPYIFDEFRQLDGSTSRNYDGTGLGLTIAYKIIKKLNGNIDVKSVLGKGSIFTITLPIKYQRKNSNTEFIDISKEEKEKSSVYTDSYLTQKKTMSGEDLPDILVIEDNPDNMTSVRALLKNKFNILESYDGEDGVIKATESLPDIILLDMSLPKMNGMEVAKILKSQKQTKNIPIIAYSASSMEIDKKEFINAGCDDFLSKPVELDILLNKLDEWLGR